MRCCSSRKLCLSQTRLRAYGVHRAPLGRLCYRATGRRVARGAAGPGGLFDESPTEPVTDEQRQISADLITAMQSKISEALEAESVNVDDVYGNHQHVNIRVVSAQFDGKNAVQRQRMVYKAIWMELQDAVHAVDGMVTQTPEEASAA